MRRTKIVCTIGPASESEEVLERLILAGMDVARLNFAHGTLEEHARVIERIRSLEAKLGKPVAILQDLPGPKIRLGDFEGGAALLRTGAEFVITSQPLLGTAELAHAPSPDFFREVRVGDKLLADDGLIELKVLTSNGVEVRCQVLTGGILRNHKGIGLPSGRMHRAALTKKDLENLEFGIAQRVDFVATSFVRGASDLIEVGNFLGAWGAKIPIIAKLEKPEAIRNLEEILQLASGVMVARGDLAVEMSIEEVPVLQKFILRQGRRHKVPVIIATQMLESMVEHPRPTRAEASDVANAILDGTDAVMLSAETATGRYPVEAVEMMVRIALKAEPYLRLQPLPQGDEKGFPVVASDTACRAARSLHAKAVVVFTESGHTARLISQDRPEVPVLALTPWEESRRRMALYWGVVPMLIQRRETLEEMSHEMEEVLLAAGWVTAGDTLVILSGTPMWKPGTVNAIKLHRVGEMW
ncbi:MAG: pyruvate kinase [candidate division NC10 bacterium]|nr:pyruvate kinase [candidate division NC10 bacterium]